MADDMRSFRSSRSDFVGAGTTDEEQALLDEACTLYREFADKVDAISKKSNKFEHNIDVIFWIRKDNDEGEPATD